MVIMDRFKDALDQNGISVEGHFVPLTAQMKYDYMAAVHTMEQLLNLAGAIEKHNKKRNDLRQKISNSCKMSLKKLVETEDAITLKQIDSAIQGLQDCRNELLKLDTADKETAKLAEHIKDGISVGR